MKSFLLYGPKEVRLAEKPMAVCGANQVIFGQLPIQLF